MAELFPTKRYLFSLDIYSDEDSIEDLREHDGLFSGEKIRGRYSHEEIWKHRYWLYDADRETQGDELNSFLKGLDGYESKNLNAGNNLLVYGSLGYMNKDCTGIYPIQATDSIIDFLNSETLSSPLYFCGDLSVWDENGRLFIQGEQYQGNNDTVTLEVRQLTNAGQEIIDRLDSNRIRAWDEINAFGRTFKPGDEGELFKSIWSSEKMSQAPSFAERALDKAMLSYSAGNLQFDIFKNDNGHFDIYLNRDDFYAGHKCSCTSIDKAMAYIDKAINPQDGLEFQFDDPDLCVPPFSDVEGVCEIVKDWVELNSPSASVHDKQVMADGMMRQFENSFAVKNLGETVVVDKETGLKSSPSAAATAAVEAAKRSASNSDADGPFKHSIQ